MAAPEELVDFNFWGSGDCPWPAFPEEGLVVQFFLGLLEIPKYPANSLLLKLSPVGFHYLQKEGKHF